MSGGSGDLHVFECRDVLAELSNFVDDDVAPEIRKEIERHLGHCRSCRILIDSTRRSVKILADQQEVELPEVLSAGIMERIRRRS